MKLNEPKWIVGMWKCYQELTKYNRYPVTEVMLWIRKMITEVHPPPESVPLIMKHTLNLDQNIEFLEFLQLLYPEAKFIYCIRDGRDVVCSIENKVWGTNLVSGTYTKSIANGCDQWNTVIDKTWIWAGRNAEIIRFEDLFDNCRYKELLDKKHLNFVNKELSKNLKLTGYGNL